MREVTRQIQGLPALQAQAILTVVPRKGARFVAKTLKSAIANAENNQNVKAELLIVKEAVAGTATTLRRFTIRRHAARPVRFSSATATSKSLCLTNNLYGPKS